MCPFENFSASFLVYYKAAICFEHCNQLRSQLSIKQERLSLSLGEGDRVWEYYRIRLIVQPFHNLMICHLHRHRCLEERLRADLFWPDDSSERLIFCKCKHLLKIIFKDLFQFGCSLNSAAELLNTADRKWSGWQHGQRNLLCGNFCSEGNFARTAQVCGNKIFVVYIFAKKGGICVPF